MINQLIDPAFLKDRVKDIARLLDERATMLASGTAAAEAEKHEVTAEQLKAASELVAQLDTQADFSRDATQAAWLPCDPHLSIIQSSLEQVYREAGAVEKAERQGLAGSADPITDETLKEDWIPSMQRPLFRQAEEWDVLGWALSFAVARGLAALSRRPDFPSPSAPATLGKKARLILVGDWASGVPRAAKVAEQMKKHFLAPEAADRDRHVIHLGDVYYAGREFEFEGRMADQWPVGYEHAAAVSSWSLPGNHDMFAGGQPYYDFLKRDTRFARQNACSHFALENEDWLVLGLDSAFTLEGLKGDVGALAAPQAQWVATRIENAPNKKIILLSHHQPFSGWENPSPKMIAALTPLLERTRPVEAWFWGHEHRCAVYEPAHNIKYPALIGHGGVPVYSSHTAPRDYLLRYHDTRSFRYMGESFSYMGFAVLDLDGEFGKVRYIDENGVVRPEVDGIG
ncbi:metallophosphoesterase family protein [Bradyrhizobium sp. HKCCYLRH1073]|uniref:metallophosphoesterase family protein n=1 Tax=unclassified Bradyrhizobium TaxID=2631580 RepID=UPI003EB6E0E6